MSNSNIYVHENWQLNYMKLFTQTNFKRIQNTVLCIEMCANFREKFLEGLREECITKAYKHTIITNKKHWIMWLKMPKQQ